MRITQAILLAAAIAIPSGLGLPAASPAQNQIAKRAAESTLYFGPGPVILPGTRHKRFSQDISSLQNGDGNLGTSEEEEEEQQQLADGGSDEDKAVKMKRLARRGLGRRQGYSGAGGESESEAESQEEEEEQQEQEEENAQSGEDGDSGKTYSEADGGSESAVGKVRRQSYGGAAGESESEAQSHEEQEEQQEQEQEDGQSSEGDDSGETYSEAD